MYITRLLLIMLFLHAPIQLSAMATQKRSTMQTIQSLSQVVISRLPTAIIIALAVAGLVYASRKNTDTKREG